MILIDAVYINKSGGKILLEYFIEYVIENKNADRYYFIFDVRLKSDLFNSLSQSNYEFIKPSEKERKLFYLKNHTLFTSFFCFANIPPPIKIINKPVSIYFHNILLISQVNSDLNIYEKIIFGLKKMYIHCKNSPNYRWIVQTDIVAQLLSYKLGIKANRISVLPFFNVEDFIDCNLQLDYNYTNYLYVSDDSKQKNHNKLLDAWVLFINDFPNKNVRLHLTLDENSSKILLNRVNRLNVSGFNVVNHGKCDRTQIKSLYTKCNYLVFPSLAESFGLPLIEATSAGCKIICSDLPYVKPIILPSLLFDPLDTNSILNSLIVSINHTKVGKTQLLISNEINTLINTIEHV